MASARFIVRGKVQGVWFRASTRDEALRLGLRGHARNLPTGEVEVLACGEDAAIAMLERWLGGGPPLARVDAVECLERVDGDIAAPVPLDFSIG